MERNVKPDVKPRLFSGGFDCNYFLLFFIENRIYVIRKNKKCGDNSKSEKIFREFGGFL